jgi:hypothetical protein
MSKEKVSLQACQAIARYEESAYLLHAFLTIDWPDPRIMVRDGFAWIDVSDHLWSAYAEREPKGVCSLFVNDLLVMLDEANNDWDIVRPTQVCLDQLGLTKSWFLR